MKEGGIHQEPGQMALILITSDIYLRLKTPIPTFLFLFKDIVSCSSSYTLSPLVTKDGLDLDLGCNGITGAHYPTHLCRVEILCQSLFSLLCPNH